MFIFTIAICIYTVKNLLHCICFVYYVLHGANVNTEDELVARIMNSAALIKQERQGDLRRATRTIAKSVEKCIEVDGGIF